MDYTKYDYSNAKVKSARIDEGLRAFMLQVYNYMAAALVLTGLVAVTASSSITVMSIMYNIQGGMIIGLSPLGWIITLAPLAMVFLFNFKLATMRTQSAQLMFWLYAGLMGLSFASLFYIYTSESIARVFFITASVFGAMSIYGYSTKRDLTGFGSFLIMGLLGIIVASVINMFLHSSGLQFAVSLLSVLIFVGLTAYDTQRLKSMYYQFGGVGNEVVSKIAIMGALALYMDFINIFIQLLQFFGDRKN